MVRRHPILTLIVIVLTILGLVSFSKSFESSGTLSKIQRLVPERNLTELSDPSSEAIQHIPKGEYGSPSPDMLRDTQSDVDSYNNTHHVSPHELVKPAPGNHATLTQHDSGLHLAETDVKNVSVGKPIMAKMPNQTIRAEVGRSGWKMLHTILAQYPETPTIEDQQTLHTYLKLFSRVYPCQECAEHFQQLLAEYPPQLSSRKTAVLWGCDAHNKVNKRLGKEIFDCRYIFDKYDCGCGSEESEEDGSSKTKTD